MKTLMSEFLDELRQVGLLCNVNRKYKTIDVVKVDARPLLDAWPITMDEGALGATIDHVRDAFPELSRRGALEHVAWNIRSDVGTYRPEEGPFRISTSGNAAPSHPRRRDDWEDLDPEP